MFMDKGLLADTTYRYKVYAMNDAVRWDMACHAVIGDTLDELRSVAVFGRGPLHHQWHYGAGRADAPVGRIGA